MAGEWWYYQHDGNKLGPFSDEEFRGLVSDGQVEPADLVWRAGMSSWQPASSLESFGVSQPIARVAHPLVASLRRVQQGLVLAIASLVLSLLGGTMTILPFLAGDEKTVNLVVLRYVAVIPALLVEIAGRILCAWLPGWKVRATVLMAVTLEFAAILILILTEASGDIRDGSPIAFLIKNISDLLFLFFLIGLARFIENRGILVYTIMLTLFFVLAWAIALLVVLSGGPFVMGGCFVLAYLVTYCANLVSLHRAISRMPAMTERMPVP